MLSGCPQTGSHRRVRTPKPGWHAKRLAVGLVALFAVVVLARSDCAARDTAPLRIAFSSRMFTDVNENDAKAAVKLWGQTVARERGIESDPEPKIFKDMPAMAQALRSNLVDAVGMVAQEYDALSKEIKLAPIFVTYISGRMVEEYLLLTHRDGTVESVGDLRGRSLTIYENPRASLAPAWLDTLLVRQGLKPAGEFFGRVSQVNKLPKVVLPVFFRQSDACVVTHSGFETIIELNPQVGKQLKIIASSPQLVPAVFCFRADYSPAFKNQLMAGLGDLHTTPAGQQVLTIFHSEKMEEQPASVLKSATELLAEHRRLCAPSTEVKTDSGGLLRKPQGGAQ
jgi:ABC-type phosphate/phosphonate transport system substrate-binding protein